MLIVPSTIPTTAGGFTVENSVWFDSGGGMTDNATPASDSNKKMTISCWAKRAKLGDGSNSQVLWSWTRDNGVNDYVQLSFLGPTDKLGMTLQTTDDGHSLSFKSNAVYRDTTAWMHLLFTVDTTPSTPTWDIFVNGSSIKDDLTQDATPAIAQNQTFRFGETGSYLGVGCKANDATSSVFYGYMAEVAYQNNVVVTDASDYGELSDDGIWIPKDISDLTYGSSSFLYQFGTAPGTGNGAGTDTSGRGNHLTENDTTASRKTTDSPTNSDDLGNYCIWNPLTTNINASSSLALSDGNLVVSNTASEDANVHGSFGLSSGKWYFEVTVNTINEIFLGVSDATIASNANSKTEAGAFVLDLLEADKYNNDGGSSYGSAFSNGDVANVAVDLDNGKIWIGKDGTYPNSGNPATGSNEMYSGISGTVFPFLSTQGSGTKQATTNFGQSSFTTSAPTGFKAVATHNMTEPTITKPSDHFQVIAYEGTSASTLTVNTNFQADWVWIKERTNSRSWHMYDTIRGVGKSLYTNGGWVEDTNEVNGYLDQFNATSIRLTNGSTSGNNVKGSSDSNTYVMYCMKAGGTASSNSDGTITSNVSANTTAGFSIVSYTGNSTADATVGHGLSSTPELIIVKNREAAESWAPWHKVLDSAKRLDLDSNSAQFSTANYVEGVTSDVFQLSSSGGVINNGDDFIAYCWHSVNGFSKIGSYTGNGATDGPFIYLGFKPSLFIVKRISGSGNWLLMDGARNTYNPVSARLNSDTGYDESTVGASNYDFLANGVKLKNDAGSSNTGSQTYIYAAFAETPFASNNRAR